MIDRPDIGEDALDLLRRMLELNQDKRISAQEAKRHKFFSDIIYH
jgi:negative regulator of replication initiation